jgi:hypothetical protein
MQETYQYVQTLGPSFFGDLSQYIFKKGPSLPVNIKQQEIFAGTRGRKSQLPGSDPPGRMYPGAGRYAHKGGYWGRQKPIS